MPPKVPYNDLGPWLWPWTQPRNLDLGRRNLTLVRETPCHNVLSFCDVSLNLLQWFLSYCWDTILTSDHDLDLGRRNLNRVWHTFSLCFIFLWSFIKFASVVYEQHNFRHNLTSDLIVTLTLGIGTQLLWATHLLIMLYLSAKFR